MDDRRRATGRAAGVVLATGALVVLTAALGLGQEPDAPEEAEPKAKAKAPARPRRGGLRAPGGAPPKAIRKGEADPLAGPGNDQAKDQAKGRGDDPADVSHYRFKLTGGRGQPLAARYYPSRQGTGAAVVILIHEKGRSGEDFLEEVEELKLEEKKASLADYLQDQGYAVLVFDLFGHGANPRRELSARDWQAMVEDVQAAYRFLIDRHNRGELNLARLGVVALGEGANLAVNWAALPGGGVSSEGRTSDLNALVLVSPMIDAQGQGLKAAGPIAALANRVPIAVFSGERDAATAELVTAVRPVVTRSRNNRVETFPTALHGYRLLRFEPKAASAIAKFLEGTIKFRASEWEPRYNLYPVAYADIRVVRKDEAQAQGRANNAEAPAKKKQQP